MARVFKWSSNRSSKNVFKTCLNQWLTVISGGNPRFKRWLTVISGGNPRLKRWLSVISDGNPGLKWWLAITSDSNPLFKRKGAIHPGIELLYIHAPSIWCTLQCIISWKRREIFFNRQILSLLWFFMKVFVQNLVVPWEFLEINGKTFQYINLSIMTKNLYQKDK